MQVQVGQGSEMGEAHIRSAFDQELEAVQALVMQLGGLVERALLDAAEALVQRDAAMAARVRAEDARIDALEERIQTACARSSPCRPRRPMTCGWCCR